MNMQEAQAAWQADRAMWASKGVELPGVVGYLPDEFRHDAGMALDALGVDSQPASFTNASSGPLAWFTTLIDPEVIRVRFANIPAADIIGERRKGTWLDSTAVFQVVEHNGEVSSYGDYNENGRAGVNTNWPTRQAYLFQTIVEYGDRELELAGLSRLNYAAELDMAAANVMNRFQNLTYFFGVQGMQNYGMLNDPLLGAALTPSTKVYGHAQWFYSGAFQATANEIYADIQAMYAQLVAQTQGLVDENTPLVLVMSPQSQAALKTANSFGITVAGLLKDSFPNLQIKTAPQYGALTSSNPFGVAAGNMLQLIATSIDGQDTVFCAYNEKLRGHTPVRGTSSVKKKTTSGTWGTVIRMPVAVVSMVGV